MGRKPDLTAEERHLTDLIRQGHETLQALKEAIKEARLLALTLVDDFEVIHKREIQQLSNHFVEESNRASADLNQVIADAQRMILDQIMNGEAVFDRRTATVCIRFGRGRFDDAVPLPYPKVTTEETST